MSPGFKFAILTGLGFGHVALSQVPGFDISDYQPPPYDFSSAYADGARFVIIKATEGTTFTADSFSSHYDGATAAGFIRGAYHYAQPGSNSGADEANFFLENGGNWSGDGITLPGMLDLEGDCALSADDMVAWIQDFSDTYYGATGRYPLLYCSPSWWEECTGDSSTFIDNNPLVMANYNSVPDTPPGSWPFYTIWQYDDAYAYGGDSDEFNGDTDSLAKLATG